MVWHTSSPAASGTFTKSGKLVFNDQAFVDMTFKAQSGYQLGVVSKQGQNITSWLDGNGHTQFGPVNESEPVVAVFSVINPTGDFKLTFPEDGNATAVTDVTAVHAVLHRDRYDRRDRREYCDRRDGRDRRPRRLGEEAPRLFISFTRLGGSL